MDLDLRDDLDRCFDDGPPVDDTDRLLDRGRTALRRRRLVEGVSALAVTAVVAAATLAASGAGTEASPDHPPVASSTAAAPAATVSFTVVTDPALTGVEGPVALMSSHQLRIAPGVELRRIVIDPYDPAVYAASVAIAYRWDGMTYWHLLYTHGDGTTTGELEPARDGVDFDDWLAERVRRPAPSMTSVVVDPGLPADDPVTVDSGAGLHVAPDVRIVRIVTNPFHRVAPAASTAAMYVRDGAAFWFVASVSGTGGATATSAAGHGFDEWVADHADMPEVPDGGHG